MSNILNTAEGRSAITQVQSYLLQRRMSRFFKRNLVIDYEKWRRGDGFDLETLVGELNENWDDEIIDLYRLLALTGALPTTLSNLSIYIDPIAGSDTTGDGTATRPFQTLWFLDTLPRKIDHQINILFSSDYTHGDDANISVEFGVDGYLSFVGVGAPTVYDGPYEISGTALLDDGFSRTVQTTANITQDPTGYFMVPADGTDAGIAQAVHSQWTTDRIILPNGALVGIAPGDNINFVRPSVTLNFRELSIQCRNTQGYSATSRDAARISFLNVRIEITDSANTKNDCILIDSSCALSLSFVQIVPPSNGTFRISQQSELNTQNASVLSESLASSGITNIVKTGSTMLIAGVSVLDKDGPDCPLILEGKALWFHNRGLIDVTKTGVVQRCTAMRIRFYDSVGSLLNCLSEGVSNGTDGAGLYLQNASVDVDGFTVLAADNVMTVLNNSRATVENAGKDSVYSNITLYGILASGVTTIEVRDDGARLVGTTNAINFDTVNPAVAAAMPAAYGFATDAQLSMVKRLSV